MSDDIESMEFEDDDLNFDDDASFDISMEPPKDDRTPLAIARDSVLSDVKRDMTDPHRLTSIVRENLPAGYSSVVQSADSFTSTARELYNDAVADVGPSVRELKKQARRAMPRMKNYMPDSWASKIESFLEDEEESRGVSQQNADDSAIASSLASIFEQQNATAHQEQLEETAEKHIEKKVDEKRHAEDTNIQVSILNRLQQMVDYNNRIDSKVSRQSLELQFRSYFTLRDLLEVTKRTSEDSVRHLEDIVKNTGLPDLLKHQPSENALQMLEDSLYGKRIEDLTGAVEPYIAKLKGRAKERFKGFTARIRDGLQQGADMAAGLNDGAEMAESAGMKGPGVVEIGSTLVSGNIVDRLSRWMGGKIREGFDRDPTTNNEQLARGMADLDGLLARLANTPQGEDVYFGKWKVPKAFHKSIAWLAEGESNAVQEQMATAVSNIRGKETQAVANDMMQRKTIVEVIPFYLRQQLSKLDILTGGNGEEWVYNPAKGRMTTMATSVKDIRRELYDANDERSKLSSIRDSVEQLDPEGTLDRLERRKIAQAIDSYAREGLNFVPKEFADLIETSVSPELANKLRELMNFDESGDVADKKGALNRIRRLTSTFKDVRKSYGSDRQQAITDYSKAGALEILERAGILQEDGTRKGSELRYNDKMQRDFRQQVIRGLFRDDLENDETVEVGKRLPPPEERKQITGPVGPSSPSGAPEATERTATGVPVKLLRDSNLAFSMHPEARRGQPNRAMGNRSLIANAVNEAISSGSFLDRAKVAVMPEVVKEVVKATEVNNLTKTIKAGGTKPGASWVFDEAQREIPKVVADMQASYQGIMGQPNTPATPAMQYKLGQAMPQGTALHGPARPEETFSYSRTPMIDDPEMKAYRQRQEQAEQERQEEERKKAEAEKVNDPQTIVDHLKELIGVNTQGFADAVEAIMASSPNDEEVRKRYYDGLRGRMKERMHRIGGIIGGTFKTGLELTKIPFKVARGAIDGVIDVFGGERDIYVRGEGDIPVLTVAKMRRGQYKNAKGKVLNSLKGIKDVVFDLQGNEVLTLAQLKAGIYTKTALGKKVNALGNSAKDFVRRQFTNLFGKTVGRVFKFGVNRVRNVMDFTKKLGNRHLNKDLFLKGMLDKPRLSLADLKAGMYFHPDTGKVLTSFSQIAKGVKDKNGDWILHPDDIPNLVDINGHVQKIRGFIGSYFRVVSKPVRMGYNALAKAARYVNRKTMERIKTDVYVYQEDEKGEAKLVPRLYYDALKRGEYYHRSEDGVIGRSLVTFAEIRGPIVDNKNVTKLSEEDIRRGLFDKTGKRLVLAGTIGYLARSAKNIVMTPIRKIVDMAKGFSDWVFGGDKLGAKESLLSKITGFFGGLRRPKIETMKVTTDIVYINGKSLVAGDGKVPAIGKVVKDYGKSVMDKVTGRVDGLKRGARKEIDAARTIKGFKPADKVRAGLQGEWQGRRSDAETYANILKNKAIKKAQRSSRFQRLKDKLLKGRDKARGFDIKKSIPNPIAKFTKEFNFDWDHPDFERNLKVLQRRVRMGGTRKHRALLKAMEAWAKKNHAKELVGPMPQGRMGQLKGRLAGMRDSVMGNVDGLMQQREFDKNFIGPKPQGRMDQIKGRVTGIRDTVMGKVDNLKQQHEFNKNFVGPKRKRGDVDGDGLRDGGYRERAKEKAQELKEKALKLFRSKQTKNGEEQLDVQKAMLESLKRTEKHTKESADEAGGSWISTALAALAGGVAGGGGLGVMAKLKDWFGNKGTKEAGKQAGKQAAKQAAKAAAQQAGKGVVRTVATRAAMFAGRMLLMPVLAAGAAIGTVSAGTVAAVAAGLAAIGAGGYALWKYRGRRAEPNPIERYRFISYGFNPDNEDELVAIRYLEDEMDGEVTASGFKDSIGEVIEDYAEDFGISDDDAVGKARFGEWLVGRFQPIFASWTIGAAKLGVDLEDVYDDLKREDYILLAKATFYKAYERQDPYSLRESPFEGRTLAGRSTVSEALQALVDGDTDSKKETKEVKTEIDTGRKEGTSKAREDQQRNRTIDRERREAVKRNAALVLPPVLMGQAPETAMTMSYAPSTPTRGKVVLAKAEREAAAQEKRLAHIRSALTAGVSLTLPPELTKDMTPEHEAQLKREIETFRKREEDGQEPELPTQAAKVAHVREQREARRQIAKRMSDEVAATRRLTQEDADRLVQQQMLEVAINSDNTLFHMYSIMEERLPMPEDDKRLEEALASREKRRAELRKKRVNVTTEDRKPPAPVSVKTDPKAIDFSKSRQKRI